MQEPPRHDDIALDPRLRSSRPLGASIVLAVIVLASSIAAPARAQSPAAGIQLDGTLRPGNAGVVLPGPDVEIPTSVGVQHGGNLFHSFQRFNVATGGSATFLDNPAGAGRPPISRVIGRVTGGDASHVDGVIRSAIPRADVFLFNPAGIVFGAGARLDIDGSFHASTAHALRFGEGDFYRAIDPGSGAPVTSDAPIAFGFLPASQLPPGLDPQPAPIRVEGSILGVAEGHRLSLVGGDLDVRREVADTLPVDEVRPVLGAAGGTIDLVAVASPGEVELRETDSGTGRTVTDVVLSDFDTLGDIYTRGLPFRPDRAQREVASVAGDGAGTIHVRARDVDLETWTGLTAANLGPTDANQVGIDLRISGDLTMTDASALAASAWDAGRAGGIDLSARRIELIGSGEENTNIGSRAFSSGDAGRTRIEADEVILGPGTEIQSNSVWLPDGPTRPTGNGGDIVLDVGRLELGEGAFVSAISANASVGNAGNIEIDANEILIRGRADGVGFAAISTQFGSINDPAVTIGRLPPEGDGFVFGSAGDVSIRTGALTLENGAQISSNVRWGGGDGGEISVVADTISLDRESRITNINEIFTNNPRDPLFYLNPTGRSGDVTLRTGELSLSRASSITVDNDGEGATGAISIHAGDVLLDGSGIRFSTLGASSGGLLELEADTLTLRNGSDIAGFLGVRATGESTGADITARRVSLEGGSRILVDTTGQVDAGGITIRGAERVEVREGSSISASSAGFDGRPNDGVAGSISIEADHLILADGGRISTSNATSSTNTGGLVTLDVGRLDVSSGSIDARATGGAGGGTITITAADQVRLENAAVAASVVDGQGGNVRIEADQAIRIDGRSSIDASASEAGDGGSIDLTSSALVISPQAVPNITATSNRGADGSVSINGIERNLTGAAQGVSSGFQESGAQLRSQCGAAVDAEGQLALRSAASPVVNEAGFYVVSGFELLPGQAREHPDAPLLAIGEGALERLSLDTVAIDVAAGPADVGAPEADESETELYAAVTRSELGDLAMLADEGTDRIRAARSAGRPLELVEAYWDRARTLRRGDSTRLAHRDLRRAFDLAREGDAPALQARLAIALAQAENEVGAGLGVDRWLDEARRSASRVGEATLIAQTESTIARIRASRNEGDEANAALSRARAALAPLPARGDLPYLWTHVGISQAALADGGPAATVAAFGDLERAARMGRALGDDRALAFAAGNLADLYLAADRPAEALGLVRAAQAASRRADDLRHGYRNTWRAGRALWALGRAQDAIDAFERALDEYASDASADRDRGFDPNAQPDDQRIYRDLLDAYFASVDRLADDERSERLLRAAIGRFERLKRAELRSYYRDECIAQLERRTRSASSIDPGAAILYPIVLADRVELVLEHGGRITRRSVAVDAGEIAHQVSLLHRELQRRMTRRYVPPARKLYAYLVAPVEAILEAGEIETLVIVPDSTLRMIPFAALLDGDEFLVQRYSVAVTPGVELVDPQDMDPTREEILLGGVSDAVQGFPALSGVAQELSEIRALYGGEVWINESFARSRLDDRLNEAPPGIVHIASHGRFTGDPATSFVLTYDGRLSINDLERLVSRSKYSNEPVELLVLSACDTAVGDSNAALGLAGVAVRAGARSALGSLWSIDDDATRRLLVRFYRELGETGLSKAQALRKAQLALLEGGFDHPYFWSSFLLISNWL